MYVYWTGVKHCLEASYRTEVQQVAELLVCSHSSSHSVLLFVGPLSLSK